MDEHEKQQQRFKKAVEEKSADAREQAEASRAEAENEQLDAHEREQGDIDPRTKNSGHGQVPAEKGNQWRGASGASRGQARLAAAPSAPGASAAGRGGTPH